MDLDRDISFFALVFPSPQSVCLSVYLSLSFYLSVYLSVCMSVCKWDKGDEKTMMIIIFFLFRMKTSIIEM